MSTQIFIKPDGCKVEYTKINAHSFYMSPAFNTRELYYGGFNSSDSFATWSKDKYDYSNSILAPKVRITDKTAGIPLPINLVADDVVTLSGTAYFNNGGAYAELGWDVTFILGVYYFDCTYNEGPETQSFTFIPVATYPITVQTKGSICFEENVTLDSNFDIHQTRFLVGFTVDISCPGPGICPSPGELPQPDLATVSYTFDIQRPCAVITSESNFIIRNCCEPIITELVNIPGLTVGSFHVDDEGNCWEVISASNDVTNFTRNFVDNYTSCVECQTANPCPQNLLINSCCVLGKEYVTGSLPGLNVGDTFVDNNGLCWFVSEETGAPISEESITVDTIIPGGCEDCILANPCPSFWFIRSCCTELVEVIATSTLLNVNDSFVDTNGICWSVVQQANQLPTNYGIIVDTVYSGGSSDINCENCTTANPCPTEYFITVRACCDNDRVEVISVPSLYMTFSEGSIFQDPYALCWEVMSYSTTGVETYPISWNDFIGIYPSCDSCINSRGKALCRLLWEVRDCATNLVYTAVSAASPQFTVTIGSFYSGFLFTGGFGEQACFEVLGYGYPASGISGEIFVSSEYGGCEECSLTIAGTKVVELQPCCGGPNVVIQTNLGFSGGIGAAYVFALNGIDKQCYTLIGYSLSSPSFINPPDSGGGGACITCVQKHACI